MSVFQKLKGTFQNAQQDIVDGLRSLATLDTQPKIDQLKGVRAKEINLDAGGDLLLNYQKAWKAIQAETKDSASKAAEASRTLAPMFKSWDHHAQNIQLLEDEVKAIPALLSTLKQLQELLGGLRQDFMVAEKSLDMLEDLCDQQDHKKRMAEEEGKLTMYAMQRENEYQKLKVDLAQRHAKKMAQAETVKRAQLSERAEAFTSAFKEDLEFYRTHGRPERLPTEFPKVSSLSEIEIEQDKQALDTFLGATVEITPAQAPEGATADDTYFEDDYITDFVVKDNGDPAIETNPAQDSEDAVEEELEVKQDSEFISETDYLTVPAKIETISIESLDDTDDEEPHKDEGSSAAGANEKVDAEAKDNNNSAEDPGVKDSGRGDKETVNNEEDGGSGSNS